ncbi:hypothetical protein ABZS66_60560, partial [Dactylosporangium sp. NPDC005572]|uniref:hypothetical protein n=1 Tax=Dactylosporangium sp. NPDC005572 TaxID=3156889 RepID=UPI0033AEEFB5
FILADLRELHRPYPEVVRHGDGVLSVNDAVVRLAGDDVEILRSGGPGIDLIRAGALTVWGSGRDVGELRIPDALVGDPVRC